ncbi:PspA/IM30 family protein [Ammoniphilus sp. YIM 78166]|uniref:PspA/IM30 family protein n=1 Tax=Ammoniphilus sp. YIM 78166 TaxID=1644106 RepID=UPI0010705EF8|nr:PspA/IM30 family protein [Ammoniphilus sp. YIM 78166]
MSIINRVKDITKATVHEVLDHFEDPIAMLNQYIRDMEKEIAQAELTLASQLSLEKKTKMLLDETKERIVKRQRQAQLAVEEGQDHIARQALYDKQLAEEKLEQYVQEHDTLVAHTQKIREKLQELKDKYYSMKNKKAGLVARANLAKTSKRIENTLSPVNLESAARGFARMEEKILGLEIDAQVSEKVRQSFYSEEVKTNERVEAELEQLKQKQSV